MRLDSVVICAQNGEPEKDAPAQCQEETLRPSSACEISGLKLFATRWRLRGNCDKGDRVFLRRRILIERGLTRPVPAVPRAWGPWIESHMSGTGDRGSCWAPCWSPGECHLNPVICNHPFRAQLHREQNQNKQFIINKLSRNRPPNKGVSQKSVQFSFTLYIDDINSAVPKSLK